ncbi:MAG: protein-L-isoaspartate O-methyltransferase [Candidatus Omnitrophota bacterium]|nr:MAG: protein-L-isoaspartate O-methyltransferase [Candidatus Omnitrophota bacterium]
MKENNYLLLRKRMIEEQLIPRGIRNKKILEAFENIPRHLFVPEEKQSYAYEDHPLSIGWGQTISQPFIVALMTQLLEPKKDEKVLEIGTGSGYQSAILAYLGCKVFTIERIPQLAERAQQVLESLEFKVEVKIGDGTLGWEKESPFDKIIVTAAAKDIPSPLVHQLKIGGRLIMPIGGAFHQELIIADKVTNKEVKKKSAGSCIFVPLIGKYVERK